MPNVTDEMKKEMISKFTMTFLENGNYDFTGRTEDGSQGSWQISEDGVSLTTKSSDGQVDLSTVVELTSEKLVLTQADSKLSFEKVK